ncbi:MAG: hypothetical protein H8E30_11740 [Alphaproteobacteria bacterium]|nr:hypothetical protein [Alphaproteobacteria bacterium]
MQAPQAFFAAQGLHGLQAFLAAQGLHGLQAFLAAQGLHAPQPFFLAAQGLHGLQAFLAAQGLQAPQPFFLAAQGLHGLQAFLAAQGLHAAAVIRRGMAHFRDAEAPAPPHGLQGLQAPQAFLAPQGLHGLQAFLAAQGLQAPQPFFLAAQGLQAPQPRFFAPQGLQAAKRNGVWGAWGVWRPGVAGIMVCWPLATAAGFAPLLAPGVAAKAIFANGMADPVARAAPMTTCKTDAVGNRFFVKCTVQPPSFLFVDDTRLPMVKGMRTAYQHLPYGLIE